MKNSERELLQIFQVDELIHSSFRYYLGRRTIATCAFDAAREQRLCRR